MIDAQVVQNVRNALRELQEERSLVERKIAALTELLATAPVKKRGPGRPRKAVAAVAAPRAARKAAAKPAAKVAAKVAAAPAAAPVAPAKPGRKPAAAKAAVAAKKGRRKAKWSPAARKAARDRMKKYWAARNKKK